MSGFFRCLNNSFKMEKDSGQEFNVRYMQVSAFSRVRINRFHCTSVYYYYRILLDQVLLDVNTTLQFEYKAGLVNGKCSCQLLISKKMFQCLNES